LGGEAVKSDKIKLALIAAAAAIYLAGLLLAYSSLDSTSWTYDEPNYLDAARHIAGLGSGPHQKDGPSESTTSGELDDAFPFDRENTILHPPLTFYLNGFLQKWAPMGSPDDDLFLIRCVSLLLFFSCTALIVFLWARELLGIRAAAAAVGLFAFCPIVLAHARLATTDMAACCTFFCFFYAVWRLIRKPGWVWTLVAGILLGLALLAKYSTVLAIPIALCILVFALAGRNRAKSAGAAGPGRLVLFGASVLLIGLLLLLAAYGFTGAFDSLEGKTFRSGFFQTLAGVPVLNNLPLPLPGPYLEGIDFQKQITETGFTSFLLGERHYRGVWYYFPLCFVMKMPLPFLVLLAAGLLALFRIRTAFRLDRVCLLLPPALFFLYLVWPNTSNAGFRYAMPAIPFLCIAAGGSIRLVTGLKGPARLTAGGIAIALSLWYLIGTVGIHPHYIAYQNEAAGGPENAWRLVAGSDLDWGQDQEKAREWFIEAAKEEKVTPQPGTFPVTGKVIINVNEIQDCLRRRDVYDWLRRFDPVELIGYTYLVFDLKLDDFRRLVEQDAGNPDASFALAAALLSEGLLDACRKELDRALKLEPNARVRFLDGKFHLAVRQTAQAIASLTKAVEIDPTLFDAYIPLRFFLVRTGRLEEETRIRRLHIESEILLAHVGWQKHERRVLEEKAADGSATLGELCSLAVLSWIDGSAGKALEHARKALEIDPWNMQALGNSIFLLSENGGIPKIEEAKRLRVRYDELAGTTLACSTPVMRSGASDRIVFGDILTFDPPSVLEIQIRLLLERGPDVELEELSAMLGYLLDPENLSRHAGFLPEVLRLLERGLELFPEDSKLGRLDNQVKQMERSIR